MAATWLLVAVGSASAQRVADVDPCALLTDDEVAAQYGAIDGGAVEDALPNASLRQCSWMTSGSGGVLFGGLVLQVTGVRDGSLDALIARLEGDRYFPLDAYPITAVAEAAAAYAVDPDADPPTVFLIAAVVDGLQVSLVPGESPAPDSPAFAGLLDLLWAAVARLVD